jgi:putative tryptophan/tyrosine transport system substrate-binding protein
LPAIYGKRFYVAGGRLISYGPDLTDRSRHAASYVDRILKGEKPADLSVQDPTKYALVINLHTAKALGSEHAKHDHPETVCDCAKAWGSR